MRPSGVTLPEENIADTIATFSQGIVDAKRLGFDTVEIHGASGYLLDQFFWSGEFTSSFAGESVRPASLGNLVQRLEKDEFDLIAVGRALLGDAEWVRKVRKGDTDSLKDFSVSELSTLL